MKNKAYAAPYLVWMVLFIIVPLALVIVFAFTDTAGNFTFDNFSAVLDLGRIFLRSFWLALLSSVICLVLGYPVAYALSRLRRRRQGLALMLLILPMWMNFLLRTYSLILLIDTNGLINQLLQSLSLPTIKIINTQFAVLIGMVYNYLPFMILPIYSVLIKIDHSLIEAAEDLGAAPMKVFSKITLPLSVSGVITGITMVFLPAVSTFVISRLLGGGKVNMVGNLIETQFLTSSDWGFGSALSVVVMVLILISMFIMNRFGDDEQGGGLF